MTDDQQFTVENNKIKADIFYKIAQRAADRHESRRRMEWQVALALWTALAVAAGFAVNSSWTPNTVEVFVSTVVALAALICTVVWLQYLETTFARDMRASYFWETALEKLAGQRKPVALEPNPGWLTIDDVDADGKIIKPPTTRGFWSRVCCGIQLTLRLRFWHRVRLIQFFVTVCLVTLVCIEVWVKHSRTELPMKWSIMGTVDAGHIDATVTQEHVLGSPSR